MNYFSPSRVDKTGGDYETFELEHDEQNTHQSRRSLKMKRLISETNSKANQHSLKNIGSSHKKN